MMTSYLYETIPQKPGAVTVRFQLLQSSKDKPLLRHPSTGQPIRRVVVDPSATVAPKQQPVLKQACRGGNCAS